MFDDLLSKAVRAVEQIEKNGSTLVYIERARAAVKSLWCVYPRRAMRALELIDDERPQAAIGALLQKNFH